MSILLHSLHLTLTKSRMQCLSKTFSFHLSRIRSGRNDELNAPLPGSHRLLFPTIFHAAAKAGLQTLPWRRVKRLSHAKRKIYVSSKQASSVSYPQNTEEENDLSTPDSVQGHQCRTE